VAAPLERQFGRIAGVTEMTSTSNLGSTSITLQFDLNRDIDGAARDVQAAINAARGELPANLPSNPTYRKVNPSDAPILIISLTSDTMTKPQMYDVASSILAQKVSQVKGVGQVFVGGSSLPAVRLELNPLAVSKYGLSLKNLRGVLSSTSVNRPKGTVTKGDRSWEVRANDQLSVARDYLPLVVSYRNGAAVKLADVANVQGFDRRCSHHGACKRKAGDLTHRIPAAGSQYHRDGGQRFKSSAATRGIPAGGYQAVGGAR
jgi:multidrug efflux pump subunit AcrB